MCVYVTGECWVKQSCILCFCMGVRACALLGHLLLSACVSLSPVHTVGGSHDPSLPDQGTSTGVVEGASRLVLEGDLKQPHKHTNKEENANTSH